MRVIETGPLGGKAKFGDTHKTIRYASSSVLSCGVVTQWDGLGSRCDGRAGLRQLRKRANRDKVVAGHDTDAGIATSVRTDFLTERDKLLDSSDRGGSGSREADW